MQPGSVLAAMMAATARHSATPATLLRRPAAGCLRAMLALGVNLVQMGKMRHWSAALTVSIVRCLNDCYTMSMLHVQTSRYVCACMLLKRCSTEAGCHRQPADGQVHMS
jgi:hypothetical protein